MKETTSAATMTIATPSLFSVAVTNSLPPQEKRRLLARGREVDADGSVRVADGRDGDALGHDRASDGGDSGTDRRDGVTLGLDVASDGRDGDEERSNLSTLGLDVTTDGLDEDEDGLEVETLGGDRPADRRNADTDGRDVDALPADGEAGGSDGHEAGGKVDSLSGEGDAGGRARDDGGGGVELGRGCDGLGRHGDVELRELRVEVVEERLVVERAGDGRADVVQERGRGVPLSGVDGGVGDDRVDDGLDRGPSRGKDALDAVLGRDLGVVLRDGEGRGRRHSLPVLEVSQGRVLGQERDGLDVGVRLVVEHGDGLEGLLDAALAREHDGREHLGKVGVVGLAGLDVLVGARDRGCGGDGREGRACDEQGRDGGGAVKDGDDEREKKIT